MLETREGSYSSIAFPKVEGVLQSQTLYYSPRLIKRIVVCGFLSMTSITECVRFVNRTPVDDLDLYAYWFEDIAREKSLVKHFMTIRSSILANTDVSEMGRTSLTDCGHFVFASSVTTESFQTDGTVPLLSELLYT